MDPVQHHTDQDPYVNGKSLTWPPGHDFDGEPSLAYVASDNSKQLIVVNDARFPCAAPGTSSKRLFRHNDFAESGLFLDVLKQQLSSQCL